MLDGLAQADTPIDLGGEALLSVLLLDGLVPVGGRELEDAARGPPPAPPSSSLLVGTKGHFYKGRA